MSLLAFQLALADMTASHAFCARVAADPDAALAGYELTPLERRRLAAAAGQRGMRVNCSLYRYNRITTLVAILPGTVHLLGGEARAVADEFWAAHPPDRNMRREAERFAGFIRAAVASGRLASPYLREVVDFEMMRYELAAAPQPGLLEQQVETGDAETPFAPHPLVRVAAFAHDPAVLLPHLAAKRKPPFDDVPEGEYHLLLDRRDGAYHERPLDARLARAMIAAAAGEDPVAHEREELAAAGLLVRVGPDAETDANGRAAGELLAAR
ncbi:hypothetical protein [Longimicrobium sp.]|uniref:hypothetical protein n=1 Tax=Longimicrobium sp. TaxID=2029185 RepID=UPI002BB598A3|nr:hypothetical protein [Longimicrobium sp.]HSU14525.1 hypothetical protein [Longimicrobium sp.]